MSTLVALALATPVWGFALAAPPPASPAIFPPAQVAQVETTVDLPVEYDYETVESATFAERHASTMMDWTRGVNLATTLALAVTGVLGAIQFHDEYGFHDAYDQTACARGDAVLDACGEQTPWAHALAAGTSASLLISSFGLSTAVDFDIAARRDGDWRVYETTRWIALGMGALQAVAGFFLANSVRFGWLDEQQDFQTMQALAAGHMALGAATLAVSTANTILVF